MAPTEKCPSCHQTMYADENFQPAGTEVTYICRNFDCSHYKRGGHHYKLKKFIDNK